MKKQLTAISLFVLLTGTSVMGQNVSTDPLIVSKDHAIVNTEYGKVRGYTNNGIFTFKGIPYAKAERFMVAQKPDSWQGVRSSMSYGPVAYTDETHMVNDEIEFPFQHNWGYRNEDCLSLNIWTQKINDGKKRPVMVWLHGGGFTAGSSMELPSYDGENLAKNDDVVLVSINHRLNVLGFLDMTAYGEKYKGSENVSITDMISALQWVKDNIAAFGGDPSNVTIFGQSGGGGKVTTLMSAPAAQGLFQKAIVQSGSYLINGFVNKALAERVSAAVLKEFNLQPSQADSLLKVPYEELNAASKRAIAKVQKEWTAEGKEGSFGWGPVLDGELLPYQPDQPEALALSKDIPLLVGSTKNEFTPFNPTLRNLTMDKVKADLQAKYGDKTQAYMAAVDKAYPGAKDPSNYVDLDIDFRLFSIRQADVKSASSSAPVYMYMFNWQSPVLDGVYKAMHCMELGFVFDNIGRTREMTGGGVQAEALADKMSKAWTNFAKTGNPNHDGLPNWPAYSSANGSTMIFDNVSEVKNHYDKELLDIASGKP